MLLYALVMAAGLAADVPEALSPEVAALQGVWEATLRRDGREVHIEKEIDGYRETVRALSGGKVAYEHAVEIEVEQTGGIHIFRWRNGQFTVGPRRGQKLADGAFVYRLRQDEWTAVFGLTDQEQGPVYREIFKRRR